MALQLKSGDRLVFATHNKAKLKELQALLAPCGIAAVSASDLDLKEPEETGASFGENALLKARAAAEASNLPALADDSGLSVEALNGAPGIYSARWAGEKKDFSAAMTRVQNELQALKIKDARAQFICALALSFPDGRYETFEGHVSGTLTFPPRGQGGFGYDPIFVPNGERKTFAEMTAGQKQNLSHRARAFALFAKTCLPKLSAA